MPELPPVTSTRASRRARAFFIRWASPSPLVQHAIELPVPGQALERVAPAVVERETGTRHEILDGARHEHLAGRGARGDARADVHGDAAVLVAHHFAFAGVRAGANLEAELAHLLRHRAGAAHGARRAVEGGEEAVARGVDLAAAKPCELAAHEPVVVLQELAPAAVAERARLLRGTHDIG